MLKRIPWDTKTPGYDIFFHPDYNRRYRSFTDSCLLARGLYRRWGISPRPEDYNMLIFFSF